MGRFNHATPKKGTIDQYAGACLNVPNSTRGSSLGRLYVARIAMRHYVLSNACSKQEFECISIHVADPADQQQLTAAACLTNSREVE